MHRAPTKALPYMLIVPRKSYKCIPFLLLTQDMIRYLALLIY